MKTLRSRHPGSGGKKSCGEASSILMFNSCFSLAIASLSPLLTLAILALISGMAGGLTLNSSVGRIAVNYNQRRTEAL
ncbi:MAG: hypothetical protein KME17_27555 [Cyanosarcina radialis HA8281-LM2]|nr:hypothetical protein [Cyanosarcina radialis HA8281-LM2]